MRRRDVLAFLCGTGAIRPAWAQAPTKPHRIALLQPSGSAADWRNGAWGREFFAELRRAGDVEGQNLVVEFFTAEGHVERYADLARRAAGSNPDVIVTVQTMLPALVSATHTIPVVASFGAPLLWVTSLARPGGIMTGVSLFAGMEQRGKQLELLKEAVPSAKRVAFLGTQYWAAPLVSETRESAAKLGMSLVEVQMGNASPQEIERGFAELARRHADAMLLSAEGALFEQARLTIRLAEENRLPAMYQFPFYVQFGGLMAYTFEPGELGRELADDVHRILHGAKPGDIPIYQPTRFKLTINLKAAKAIGLTFPPSILARADEVIE